MAMTAALGPSKDKLQDENGTVAPSLSKNVDMLEAHEPSEVEEVDPVLERAILKMARRVVPLTAAIAFLNHLDRSK